MTASFISLLSSCGDGADPDEDEGVGVVLLLLMVVAAAAATLAAVVGVIATVVNRGRISSPKESTLFEIGIRNHDFLNETT